MQSNTQTVRASEVIMELLSLLAQAQHISCHTTISLNRGRAHHLVSSPSEHLTQVRAGKASREGCMWVQGIGFESDLANLVHGAPRMGVVMDMSCVT